MSVRQTNLSRATTLPLYGMGLSLKFIYVSVGSRWVVRNTPESGLTPNAGQHSTMTYLESPEDTWVLPPWRRSYTQRTELDCRGMLGR
jgi:hypothetical protein